MIDLDNHNDVGWIYWPDNPQPVASIGLPYIQRLKKVYDLGPDVLMSSSRNLGTYACWKLPRTIRTKHAYKFFRRKLAEAGLPKVEIYPVPPSRKGEPDPQCHRRPFGEGCWTYTPGGMIKRWVDQTLHFEAPGPLPSFRCLVEMMLARVSDQLDEWERWGGRAEVPEHRTKQNEEAERINAWLDAGCPGSEPETIVVPSDGLAERVGEKPQQADPRRVNSAEGMPEERRQKKFVRRCWELATFGLPEEDSANWAIYELAKWLCGVECYYLPSEAKIAKVRSLLWTFVEERNNGFCSRFAEGQEKLVKKQIERIIAKAEEKAEEPFFQELRHRYREGYRRPLVIEYILTGEGKQNLYYPGDYDTTRSPSLVPFISEQPHSLPAEIEDRVRQCAGRTSEGKEKLLSFARQFCGLLVSKGGRARVHVMTLGGFLGYEKPEMARGQVARYKRKLEWLIAETGGYRVGERSKEYTLLLYEEIVEQRRVAG